MISRRHRLIAITAVSAIVFVLGVGAILWLHSTRRHIYIPGSAIEGLTDTLGRSLPSDRPDVHFTDVTAAAGIRFQQFPGVRTTRLPEDMGSGAAWGDYDRDGWLDLFVVNQSGPMTLTPAELAASDAHATLYHNRGDGTFEDVSKKAGVDWRGTGMGVAWGDYDGDGWPDILMTTYGGLVLYHNLGNGTFENVTARAGLSRFHGFYTGVAWADYDGDGDLDAYVGGYVDFEDRPGAPPSKQYDIEQPTSLNPSAFDPEPNLLLRNNGDGTFTDVARQAGVADPQGRTLSVAWADFDNDGRPDLYVDNDLSDNAFYHNLGHGKFEDLSHLANVADYRGAMGLAIGDWNGDGDLDLFITHWLAQENALYDNDIRRLGETGQRPDALLRFMDVADQYGLGQIGLDFIGWGTSFFDYDNDGRLDLLVVNGSTIQETDDPKLLVPMHDLLFWNGGPKRGFFDVSSVSGPYFARKLVGRGATFGDYDNDGDVDVFIVNNQGPGILLRNDGGNTKAWLELSLEGRRSNRGAVGARVRVVADGRAQIRELGDQPSYLSQDSPVLHFGLGSASVVDTLQVRWPAGETQVFTSLPVRSRLHLVEGGQPTVVFGSGQPATKPVAELGSRQRVQDFWGTYRKATRERISGRRTAAAASYRAALALNPAHEDALYYLGSVLFDLDSLEASRRVLRRLLSVNPRSARGYSRLGVVELCSPDLGPTRLDSAESRFRAAASFNREALGSYVRLAEVALAKGDEGEASRAVSTVLDADATSRPGHFLGGYRLWLKGRRDEALRSFEASQDTTAMAGPKLDVGDGCDAFLSLRAFLAPGGDTAVATLMDRRYSAYRSGLRRLMRGWRPRRP